MINPELAVLPPNNTEAERSVIGGLLIDDDNSERTQKVLGLLNPEMFYTHAHQVIFTEMQRLYRAQTPVDLLTLFDSLESRALSESVGGFAYLAELSKIHPAQRILFPTLSQCVTQLWSATLSSGLQRRQSCFMPATG